MIVLALIGVLAAIISMNGLNLFKDAHVDSVVSAHKTMKQVVSAYTFKNKVLPASEAVLIQDGYVDGSIVESVKVGTGTTVVFNQAGNAAGEASAGNGFDLDGDGTVDTAAGDTVVQMVIAGVTPNEANEISTIIDGAAKTPAVSALDAKGRVEYPIIAAGATGSVTIYVDRK